jgi:hypothetical protein
MKTTFYYITNKPTSSKKGVCIRDSIHYRRKVF